MIRSQRRLEKIRSVLALRQRDLAVVLENVHDPHNVSAILRSCDAVGVLGIELLYTREKFPKIGRKSSSSANKWLERRKHVSVDECYRCLRAEGFTILATRVDPRTQSLYDLDLCSPTAFVFGNEHRGVSEEAALKADACFRIPMVGMIESLNVSVAAAVCLYEALRQRLARGPGVTSALPPQQREDLFKEWAGR
jgi:tRNA (guanosine-2'-O-)-methyltransferase